jgi:thioesterase domain-containing protein
MGHSYGGLVAHEMARLLEADGQRAAVIIIDTAQERRAQPGVPTTRRSQSRAYLALYRQYHGVRSVLSRPGTAKRYHQMFQRTALHERHHQPGLVQGPVLVVGTVESAGRLGWDDQPNRTTFVVDGTHLSIVQPPLASDVAAAAAATFALLDDLP